MKMSVNVDSEHFLNLCVFVHVCTSQTFCSDPVETASPDRFEDTLSAAANLRPQAIVPHGVVEMPKCDAPAQSHLECTQLGSEHPEDPPGILLS